MITLLYTFYLPFFRYYCENPLRILWSYFKLLLNFRRRLLRMFSYLSLILIFVFLVQVEVTIFNPALEKWAEIFHCAATSVFLVVLALLVLLGCYLPGRWRLASLALLGSQCYYVLYNYLHGKIIYYHSEWLNLAITRAGEKEAPAATGFIHEVNMWICAHPYITMGIGIAVGITITCVVMLISRGQAIDELKAEVEANKEALVQLVDQQEANLTQLVLEQGEAIAMLKTEFEGLGQTLARADEGDVTIVLETQGGCIERLQAQVEAHDASLKSLRTQIEVANQAMAKLNVRALNEEREVYDLTFEKITEELAQIEEFIDFKKKGWKA